jgi:hypothetical protein
MHLSLQLCGEEVIMRITGHTNPSIKQELISKIIKVEKTGGASGSVPA